MKSYRPAAALTGALLAFLLATASGCDHGGSAGTDSPAGPATSPSPVEASQAASPPADTTSPAGPSPSAPAGSGTQYEKARKLVECMRANGVPDFPDPNPDGTFGMDKFAGMDMLRMQEVFLTKCRQFGLGRHQ
jgi:hypothetical protein